MQHAVGCDIPHDPSSGQFLASIETDGQDGLSGRPARRHVERGGVDCRRPICRRQHSALVDREHCVRTNAAVIFSSTGIPGRDAQSSQHRVEHRVYRCAVQDAAERRPDGRAALLPLVRLHRHHLAAAALQASPSRITLIRWMRRPSANWPTVTRPRCCCHADVLFRLRAQVRAGAIRAPAHCGRRCRENQRTHRPRLRGPLRHRPIGGYGCTEMAPGVAINVVPTADGRDVEPGRAGSVGRTLPGIDARVVDTM